MWTKLSPKKNMFDRKLSKKWIPYILAYNLRHFGRFLNFFSQFDLYAGQTLPSLKHLRIGYFFILKDFDKWKKDLKISEFWTYFWTYFFNSTYTRVDLYAGRLIREYIRYSNLNWFLLFHKGEHASCRVHEPGHEPLRGWLAERHQSGWERPNDAIP
jgi:hypothetical protein